MGLLNHGGKFGIWASVLQQAYREYRRQHGSCTDASHQCGGDGGTSHEIAAVLALLEGKRATSVHIYNQSIPIFEQFVKDARKLIRQMDQDHTGVTRQQLEERRKALQGQGAEAQLLDTLISNFNLLHNLSNLGSDRASGTRESISVDDLDTFHQQRATWHEVKGGSCRYRDVGARLFLRMAGVVD